MSVFRNCRKVMIEITETPSSIIRARFKRLRRQLIENEVTFESFYQCISDDYPEFKDIDSKNGIRNVWYGSSTDLFVTTYAENLLKMFNYEEI